MAGVMTRRALESAIDRALASAGRQPSDDGRGTVISPTASGLAKYRSVRRARAELYDTILAAWSESDRRTLATMLHRLNDALDAHTRPR